jgi:hypothetical protein
MHDDDARDGSREIASVTITTGEARRIADAWLGEEAPSIPELVGAMLVGSTRGRDLEAPHPAASDVDVFLWVDAEVPNDIEYPRSRFAPRKLLRDGIVLENDGDEDVRARSRAGYGLLLASLGIESDEAFDTRVAALQSFAPDLRQGCDALLARNPAVLD